MVQIAGCGERWNRVDVASPAAWRAATDALISTSRIIAQPGELLTWLDEPCALAVPPSGSGRSVGIRVAAFTLVIFDKDGQLLKTMPLGGASNEDVVSWLSKHGIDASATSPLPPTPDHEALSNLERTISNAHAALGHIATATHGASAVHTDPETLETTITIRLASREGEGPRVITAGFFPGGEQGELFVRAHPGEGDSAQADLPMRDVAAKSDVDAQATAIETFLHNSLRDAYASLHREWRPRRPSTH